MKLAEKIQKVKCELAQQPLQKSGLNSFNKYKYFELGDFMPTLNKLMLNNRISSFMSFDKDTTTLTIMDMDTEDKIVLSIPSSTAEIKGMHAVQNQGAVITYQRRYLMTIAFDIVDNDIIDNTTDKDSTTDKNKLVSLYTQKIGQCKTLADLQIVANELSTIKHIDNSRELIGIEYTAQRQKIIEGQ